MSNKEVKDWVVAHVNEHGPIKVIDLTLEFTKEFGVGREAFNLFEAIIELVKDKLVIEVEYVLPSMSYRSKSMLFPAGTELLIKGL